MWRILLSSLAIKEKLRKNLEELMYLGFLRETRLYRLVNSFQLLYGYKIIQYVCLELKKGPIDTHMSQNRKGSPYFDSGRQKVS